MDKPTFRFAGVEVDCARRQVRGEGGTVEPPPLVFDALVALARRADQVVAKDELAGILWPDRVVTEASISQVIRKARVALEQCGGDPGVIKTQHGHGYRLDATVTVDDAAGDGAEWQQHPFRTGAIVALLGGILVTLANVSDVLQWVLPDDSVVLLEETQSAIETTDAKVDELIQLLRYQAAKSGEALGPDAERTIRAAVAAIVDSADAGKQQALARLSEGDVEAAGDAIAEIAGELDTASVQSVAAAASSWREAGAVFYASNLDKSIRAYESALRLRPDDAGLAVELAFAYLRAGRADDALSLFESTAATAGAAGPRSDALRGAGIVRRLNGQFDAALGFFARATDAADEAGDRRRRTLVLLQQGNVALARGDRDRARELFQTAIDYAEETDDAYLLAASLSSLGIVLAGANQFELAKQVFSRAHDIHRARHDLAGQATVLGNLGATALLREDPDSAETYLLESVAIGEELGWQRSIALDLINLATIAAGRREFDLASRRLQRARDIAVSARLNETHAIILVNMGEVARDRGEPADACRLWGEALPLLEAMQHDAVDTVVAYQRDLKCPAP